MTSSTNIPVYQENQAPPKITFQIGVELHLAKNDLQQKAEQRAQKILVYGLPGRCKHLNCRISSNTWHHPVLLPPFFPTATYTKLILSSPKQTLTINHSSENTSLSQMAAVVISQQASRGCPRVSAVVQLRPHTSIIMLPTCSVERG